MLCDFCILITAFDTHCSSTSLRFSKSNSNDLTIRVSEDCEKIISSKKQEFQKQPQVSSGKAVATVSGKIVNGINTFPGQYPFMVSLRWKLKSKHFCGGSLVTAQHVLTAAHCVKEVRDPVDIYVLSGTISYHFGGDKHNVTDIRMHENYEGRTDFWQNDIAVLKLRETVTFRSFRKPVKLPTTNVSVGETCMVLGWGSISPVEYVNPSILQCLPQMIMEQSACKTEYTYLATIDEKHMCGILERGYGVCVGDGGGPIICGNEQHGITSFTLNCSQGYPNVYTRLSYYQDWIQTMINDVDVARN